MGYNNEVIEVDLLGDLTFFVPGWDAPRKVGVQRRANRLWSLIAYLALNRASEVSAEKLIEIFWPDGESDDPLRVLWLTVSRCRKALEELGVPDARSLLLASNGGYRWNPDRPAETDVERFERLAATRGAADDPLAVMLEALRLYRGDFWPQAVGEGWASTLRIYYKTLFLQLSIEAAERLFAAERWEELADVCRRAVVEEPGEERLSVYFMRALTALGQPQMALEHYEHIKKTLEDEYMVELSPELELARSEAAQGNLSGRLDADAVSGFLSVPMTGGAAFCDYPVFRRMVDFEARELRRSGRPSQVVLIDLVSERQDAGFSTDMKRMERALSSSLRGNDLFTRLSNAQYLVLLPGTPAENVQIVMDRLDAAFRREKGRPGVALLHQTIPIDSLISEQ